MATDIVLGSLRTSQAFLDLSKELLAALVLLVALFSRASLGTPRIAYCRPCLWARGGPWAMVASLV
jgi:hypothetical protein